MVTKRAKSTKEIKVLQSLFFLKSPTRSEIARHAGTSPVSVTAMLNRLQERGLVERAGKTESRSGRPSSIYRLTPFVGYTLGISVETVSFRVVAMDPRRTVLWEGDFPLSLSSNPSEHLDNVVNQLSCGLREAIASEQLKGRRPLSIGLALPGMVDTERGIWLQGLRVSGITHIPMRRIMESTFGIPVVAEDVTRCLAFLAAERRWPEGSRDLVFIYLGSGVGAGIIIGEEPHYGTRGLAGEVGHLVVEEKGERCSCGNIGCLETVVSRPSILRRFRQRLAEGVISSLQRFNENGADGLTLEAIFEAARAGDRLAASTLFEIGTFLGDACSRVITLYNPSSLVIGGPAAVLGEFLREPIWIRIRQRVLPEMLEGLTLAIETSSAHEEALGAAVLAERRFWRNAASTGIKFE